MNASALIQSDRSVGRGSRRTGFRRIRIGVILLGLLPFLAGGLAGVATPTVELTLRRLGWPPGPPGKPDVGAGPPPLSAYPFAWIWGFLIGGTFATLGAVLARMGRK